MASINSNGVRSGVPAALDLLGDALKDVGFLGGRGSGPMAVKVSADLSAPAGGEFFEHNDGRATGKAGDGAHGGDALSEAGRRSSTGDGAADADSGAIAALRGAPLAPAPGLSGSPAADADSGVVGVGTLVLASNSAVAALGVSSRAAFGFTPAGDLPEVALGALIGPDAAGDLATEPVAIETEVRYGFVTEGDPGVSGPPLETDNGNSEPWEYTLGNPPVYTGNNTIDGVLWGTNWSDNFITYSDPNSTADYGAGYTAGYPNFFSGFAQLTANQLTAAHAILNSFVYTQLPAAAGLSVEAFTGLGIDYAGSGVGASTIRLANTSSAVVGTARVADFPGGNVQAGDVWYGGSGDNPTTGNYDYATTIHELGHALGLKHGHQASNEFGAGAPVLPAATDGMEYSIMTYRSYVGGPTTGYTNETWGYAQTWMMYDIRALQEIYGADFTANSGNTVYTWSPANGNTVIDGSIALQPGGNRIFATIWDGDGIDTYDLSAYATNLTLNLNPGGFSVFSAAQLADLDWTTAGRNASGNIYNALQFNGDARSLIENAIGGSGNDSITGNATSNTLTGGAGNDTVDGGAGNDLIFLGDGNDYVNVTSSGNDTFWGGNGDDFIFGGAGNERYNGEAGNDTLRGWSGNDTINGGAGADSLDGGSGSDFLSYAGSGIAVTVNLATSSVNGGDATGDTIVAGTFENVTGSDWFDAITGDGGNNILEGGLNGDTINGGAGDDTLYANTAANIGGSIIGDILNGDDGSDVIYGSGGNDSVNGGSGADTINAGAGDDIVTDDDVPVGDVFDGGAGVDTLIADITWNPGVTYDLTAGWMRFSGPGGITYDTIVNFENLTVGGAADVTGTTAANIIVVTDTGSFHNNTINGLGGNDTISSGIGNDTIDAGDGNDSVDAGAGDDTIVDTVAMFAGTNDDVFDGGAGIDTLVHDLSWVSSVAFDLTTGWSSWNGNRDQLINIENLTVGGNASMRGDALANVLIASDAVSSGDNLMNGEAGDDLLNAGDGVDTLYGGIGNDTLWGAISTVVGDDGDFIYGEGGDDLAGGSYGNDYMDGGTGSDALYGDEGNDTVLGGDGNDYLRGDWGGGQDLSGADSLDGGAGNDTADGGAGDDTVRGGAGNDNLTGGGGVDYVDGGANNDVITDANSGAGDVFDGGTGIDTLIADFTWVDDVLYDLASGWMRWPGAGGFTFDTITNIENLTTGGGADVIGDGNANTIVILDTGGANDNTISTAGGNDTVFAGIGNDSVSGSLGDDVIHGGDGNDTIVGESGIDTVFGDGGDDLIVFTNFNFFDNVDGGAGTDTLDATAVTGNGYTFNFQAGTISGYSGVQTLANVEIFLSGSGNDTIVSDGSGQYYGNAGNDTMTAGIGTSETMDGGAGTDTLDTTPYALAYTINMVTGLTNFAGESFTNFENLNSGAGNDSIIGTAGGNVISTGSGHDTVDGGGGNDTLNGGDGNDSLNGGTGNDSLVGGLGDDSFTIDSTLDVVVEANAAGVDTVNSLLADYSLLSNFENLTLIGAGNQNGTGNGLANLMTGQGGDNVLDSGTGADTLLGGGGNDMLFGRGGYDSLEGGAGNDSLDGGTSLDTMLGGLGGDTYTVNAFYDTVIEFAGEGTDTVISTSSDFTLPDHVENLSNRLVSGVQTGRGNALDNVMTGIGADDNLFGLDGNDSMSSGGGNDTLAGGAGNDTLAGGVGNDSLNGGSGDDSMLGGTGIDTLNGGGGSDTMNGGADDDDYVGVGTGDVLTEFAGGGYDRVFSNISYTLGNQFEYLELTGSGNVGTGNALDNTLVGNANNNTLSGLDGADMLYGRAGNDSLYAGVDAVQDQFVFDTALNAATNVDTLFEAEFPEDQILLDNDIFTMLLSTVATNEGTLANGQYFEGAGFTGGGLNNALGIWYNLTTGGLYYNPTGNVAGDSILFASIDGASPALARTDFTLFTDPGA